MCCLVFKDDKKSHKKMVLCFKQLLGCIEIDWTDFEMLEPMKNDLLYCYCESTLDMLGNPLFTEMNCLHKTKGYGQFMIRTCQAILDNKFELNFELGLYINHVWNWWADG